MTLNFRPGLWRWRVSTVIALSVAGALLSLSGTGMFQLLEWAALDALFRLRPSESGDPRVLIVGVDEEDISQIGQWPISDAMLAQALKNLRALQPRAIGLDIYRDLTVEPGHAELVEVFESTPNLIGVEKFSGDAVAPPPILKKQDRVAINDIVLDADGKVRRGLLSTHRDGKTQLSLGAMLGLMYLESEGITPTQTDDGAIALGQARFRRFEGNDGAYVRADAGGYQLLLNFRGPPGHFDTVSLRDVLHDRVPVEAIRDRIVLIGVTARSLNDFFYNPYTTRNSSPPAGVEIHAHLASIIVSATLDGRPLMKTLSAPVEGLWIVIWCWSSAIFGCWVARDKKAAIGSIAAIASPMAITYLAFLGGWWVPVVPSVLGALAAAAIAIGYTLWDDLRRSHQELATYAQTLEHKVRERTIALEGRTLALAEKTTQLEGQATQLLAARDAAEAANRAKSSFLAHMSHELRTPLNAILGFTQLMARSATLPSEHQESVRIVNRSGEHLLSLIENVLDFSKIEAGKIDIQPCDFNLYELLEDLEEMFYLQARNKGLALTLEVAADVPECVQTDKVKLRQILINTIGNSIKFAQVGRVEIEVSAKCQQDPDLDRAIVCIAVNDTGPGIAPEELDRLFEPFMQTQAGRQVGQGTGLGLAIVRQFVERMGGRVTVESEVGAGTQFNFEIPVDVIEGNTGLERGRHQRAIALEGDRQPPRILIVDDGRENRRLLSQILEPVGFEVREAQHGAEAIAIWESWHPHFIWMDVRMPVIDGPEATRVIRAKERARHSPNGKASKPQQTAIVALSADARPDADERMLAVGCNAVVHKPLQADEALDIIARYLGISYQTARPTPTPQTDAPQTQAATEVISQPNLKASLTELQSILPPQWFDELNHAAIAIDNEWILQLLQQIPPEFASIAQQIEKWVETFRCDRIVESLEFTQTEDASDLRVDSHSEALLQSMPPEWVANIYWAAATGDDSQLCHLIDRMPVPNTELAKLLLDLVAEFQFETVMALTEFVGRERYPRMENRSVTSSSVKSF